MWARIVELILAIWLFLSHFIFPMQNGKDLIIACLIFLFAALSFIDKLNKMHLLQVLPVFWLLYLAFSYPTPWLPFSLQNYILVALLLLVFAITPSRASEPPRPWRRFLKEKDDAYHPKE